MVTRFRLALIWLLMFAAATARADTYVFDRQNTLVAFAWERSGLSRQQGRFNDVSGTVEFDPAAPEDSKVDVTIRASSLQTGVDLLDRSLRSVDFFDVASFPVITFKSTRVIKTGDKTAEVEGDLTIVGVTKPAKLDVTWRFTGVHPLGQINPQLTGRTISVFSAKSSVDRSAWGLTRAIPLVADRIDIMIETELLKK